MKSGLSWFSNRDAHVEHGIRNAIFPLAAALGAPLAAPLAALPVPAEAEVGPVEELVLHPASANASTAADTPTIACILIIELSCDLRWNAFRNQYRDRSRQL